MKKYLPYTMFILSAVLILSGCKKDSTSSGNYSASVSDKTWWGLFTYAGDTTEYYSVHFNTDNSLVWNQMLGEYAGTWSISSNHLTMNLGINSLIITADITGDNKLANIKTNNSSVINIGQLLTNPSQLSLDGTIWKGVFTDKIGSTYNMTMEFQTGGQVVIGLDGLTADTFTYARSASGVTIRAINGSDIWFGIIQSDTKMIGTEDKAENKFELTKQ